GEGGRTKGEWRVRIGRNGERQGDGSKYGNGSGAHDRAPACCRISFNRRVLGKFPAAKSPKKRTPGVPDAMGSQPRRQTRRGHHGMRRSAMRREMVAPAADGTKAI